MRRIILVLSIICILGLSACNPNQPLLPDKSPVQASSSTVSDSINTIAPSFEPTLTPSPTVTLTPTPTYIWPLLEGTPIPDIFEPISDKNVHRLEEIESWGIGRPSEVVFSPDGENLAVVTSTGVHIFDSVTLKKIITLTPSGDMVNSNFVYSPDGSLAAARSSIYTYTIWNTDDGTIRNEVKIDGDPDFLLTPRLFNLEFSSDSLTLYALIGVAESTFKYYSWSSDGEIETTDIRIPGTEWYVMGTDSGLLYRPGVDFKSNTVAIRDYDSVILVSTIDGRVINTFQGSYECSRIAFSENGSTLAAACSNEVKVWNLETGNVVASLPGKDMAFSPDLKVIATFSINGFKASVSLYRLNENGSYQLTKFLGQGFVFNYVDNLARKKHMPFPRMESDQLISTDGSKLLLAKWPNEAPDSYQENIHLYLFDTTDGKIIQESIYKFYDWGQLIYPAFAPGNDNFVMATDSRIEMWQEFINEPLATLSITAGRVSGMTFSPSGESFAYIISGLDGELNFIKVVDPKSGLIQKEISHSEWGKIIRFSQNDHDLTFWSGFTRHRRVQISTGKIEDVYPSASSSDGSITAIANCQNNIEVISTSRETLVIPVNAIIDEVSVSPDGKRIASISEDQTIRLWNSEDGTQIALIEELGEWSNHLEFTSDSKYLFCLFDQRGRFALQMWNAYDGSLIRTFAVDSMLDYAISPDSTLIVIGTRSSYFQFFRIIDGQKVMSFYQPFLEEAFPILAFSSPSFTFSPDGKILAVGLGDGTIHLWGVKN